MWSVWERWVTRSNWSCIPRKREKKEEERGKSQRKWDQRSHFVTHPHVNFGLNRPKQRSHELCNEVKSSQMDMRVHALLCVFMLCTDSCVWIVRSAGEKRESCPEIPWHRVPESLHYKWHTRKHTHTVSQNEFLYNGQRQNRRQGQRGTAQALKTYRYISHEERHVSTQ